jgi:hypothetical protein
MPRRKYGHMVNVCPPTPREKCRTCRLGKPCPAHKENSAIDYKDLAKKKRKWATGK